MPAVVNTFSSTARLAGLGFVLLIGLSSALQAQEDDAAPVADADPSVGELQLPPTTKHPLREDRLWLPPAHAPHRPALLRAARQALLHVECNEVLYGSLNEFRTEREGISFTILCMRDGRTTFNQVFFMEDLMSDEDITERSAAGEELERLRSLMQSPDGRVPAAQSSGGQPAAGSDSDAPSVVF